MMKNCKETLLGGGRKLVSLMLCALTVTACNDDDCINSGTDNNNLQVEVSASLHSRAPIHDSTLPDNNPIGVTLTATDGSSYDKQNYTNIPYYGTTADGKQTWQPQDKPVTLSVTEGVAMAYWPYNQNAVDMTAVPVETDTQTDYMYSGNVTGLTNAAPKAAFQMKHAMALVRVNVVRGTYTAAGTVTAVTAASEAFCTSGTMNVSTGALADLAGAETPFIEEPADAVVTTSGRMTEFLVLPDVDVDAASVILGVTVDGRKYSTDVKVTEAFKQGYIYTYNLTLDNTALNVSAVAVAPWKEEIPVEAPKPVAEDDQYIVEVTIDSDNYTYKHNTVNFIGTIDWGDGIIQTIETKTNYPSHDYATAGKYLVIATGTTTELRSQNINTRDISKIIHIGGEMGIIYMTAAFQHQKKITEIPAGIFDGLDEVKSFGSIGHSGCFWDCEKLTSIPAGLFDNCTEVEDFSFVFENCKGLKSIPAGLFDNNTKVKYFNCAFKGCSGLTGAIPAGLFDNCTEVIDFSGTFGECSSLTAIPQGLFDNNTKVTNFGNSWYNGCFWQCSGLTGNIPDGLFKYNTKVISFKDVFEGCKNLSGAIPEGLFDNCPLVTSFEDTFNGCSNLTSIPEGLFDKCTEVTTFRNTFRWCSGITEIPAGLFDNCTKNTDIISTFQGTSITKIPEGLFDSFTEVTGTGNGIYQGTFAECTKLTSIPAGLFNKCTKITQFATAFSGCSSLTEIPAGLFDNCTEVTSFSWTFQNTKINSVPEGLFDKCTKVTSFERTFGDNRALQEIPEGLFDSNPEVTNFNSVFRHCSGLAGKIPVSIFDNNRKVKNFTDAFISSSGFVSESPYTIINVDGEDKKVHLYERSLYPEHFTAPEYSPRCFSGLNYLTDWAAIVAAGWN